MDHQGWNVFVYINIEYKTEGEKTGSNLDENTVCKSAVVFFSVIWILWHKSDVWVS